MDTTQNTWKAHLATTLHRYGKRGKGYFSPDHIVIKTVKAIHLLAATAWAGGALSMQALSYLKLSSNDPVFIAHAAYCLHFVDSAVVIPGLAGCLLTGLFYSCLTSIGFVKYTWIWFKWLVSLNACFWGLLFWTQNGDQLIAWLAQYGWDGPLRFIKSCILPESMWQGATQIAIILTMCLVSVYRPLSMGIFAKHKASNGLDFFPFKCTRCGDCIKACAEVQGINAINFVNSNLSNISFRKKLADSECVQCGLCRIVCPEQAISIRSDIDAVSKKLRDPETMVVVQVAPAVRVAIGEAFGITDGANTMNALVAALHQLGFDKVHDTALGADICTMEHTRLLKTRLAKNARLPVFTSCCPAWVIFCKNRYPQFVSSLSVTRSPMQVLGAAIREYYGLPENATGKKVVSVAITPCIAKKEEITWPESSPLGGQEIDYALTTVELVEMMHKAGISLDMNRQEEADAPFGLASGGGVLFGVSGGAAEALMRCLGNKPKARAGLPDSHQNEYQDILSGGIKEFTIEVSGQNVKVAAVSGLGHAARLLENIESGRSSYDIVEVMACPGGCVMGGGQPIHQSFSTAIKRQHGLQKADSSMPASMASVNPVANSLYNSIFKGKEELLLHRKFS